MATENVLLDELKHSLCDDLLRKWYPLVVDAECGGYYTNVTSNWELAPEQEKMIVTQARHIWTTANVADFLDDAKTYVPIATHGFKFLRDVMWDKQYGGYYQIRNREGGRTEIRGWRDEKRTYGNAFGVYALAALYGQTRDPAVLELARRSFAWIEDHAFDPRLKGYFEFITPDGKPFDRSSAYRTVAADGNELGFKDQNSSIHLLEAYTELYRHWKDPTLHDQLAALLVLIRDTMVASKGYLQLFFQPDWTPVSFRDAPDDIRKQNFGLDHVSFGHDYETAFLMLEASHVLGMNNDTTTLRVGRKMLDHAIANGWDETVGGFYDGGYYFRGEDRCTIVKDTKNWWAQAEALNALLLFSRIFPDAGYYEYFLKQWDYVKKYILDSEKGDWFEGGIDKEPHFRTGPKSHMWKCTYHTCRALMNCIAMLSKEGPVKSGIGRRKADLEALIDHWRRVKSYL